MGWAAAAEMPTGKLSLLEILATDGLRSLIGLARAEPQLLGPLRTCVREGLVRVVRPGLRPTSYSRREIPTDVAMLTAAGRTVVGRELGRPASAASLAHEIEHRVGVAELRTVMGISPAAWTPGGELQHARLPAAQGTPRGRGLPDGLADVDGIRLALEYDQGSYTAVQVHLKQRVFSEMADAALWAAPTPGRADWLRRLGCERVVVIHLPLGVLEDRHPAQPPRAVRHHADNDSWIGGRPRFQGPNDS